MLYFFDIPANVAPVNDTAGAVGLLTPLERR